MFVMAVTETFKTPVVVEMINEAGHKKPHSFKAIWRRPPQSEIDALFERTKHEEVPDQEIINTYLRGWEDVKDQSNNPVEFNADNLAALLEINPTRKCLARAFFDAIAGSGLPTKN